MDRIAAPAILFALYGDIPSADVRGEIELFTKFPNAPIVNLDPLDRVVPGILLVFVADEYGATAYAITDPRSMN